MDGTLVDTEPYWIQAETRLVERFGGSWTHDDAMSMVGAGLWDSAATLRSRGVDMNPDAIVAYLTGEVRRRLGEEDLPFRPGARELLHALRERGIPTALVTMSVTEMAEQVVDAIPFHAFDTIVTGDRVSRPKPDPDSYLTAAEVLGVDAVDCIAIEDSQNGLAAAVASGARSLAVPHAVAIEPGPGYTVWPTLDGRSVDHLFALPMRGRGETE